MRRAWQIVRRPSARFGLGTLLLVGFLAGVMGLGSFTRVVEATNSLSFCTSCHVMEAHVLPDYQASVHFSNASGVRAVCADCHVPRAFFAKMTTKVRATAIEVPAWLTGRIDSPEKFEARKPLLAERVLTRMRASDSRECRECHSWSAMAQAAQAPRAWREHRVGREAGDTCVDCHQGVAHQMPASMLEPLDDDFGFEGF
jgi:cytochrome c-type protein NapC